MTPMIRAAIIEHAIDYVHVLQCPEVPSWKSLITWSGRMEVFYINNLTLIPQLMLVVGEFNILATSKVTSGWVSTVLPHWDHGACNLTYFPTQSYYPDINLTSSCPIIVMPSAWLSSDKYQLLKSLVWFGWVLNSWTFTWKACDLPNRPSRPVYLW